MGGSVCEQRARSLVTALHRELRDLGFRKRGSWLRAVHPAEPLGVAQVLGVQLTQGSQKKDCRGYINVGAGLLGLPEHSLDSERLRPQDCLLAERIGEHWDLDDDLDDLAAEVGEQAQAWFEARIEADALLAPFADRDPSTVRAWLGQVEPVVAAWVSRGQTDAARELLLAKRAVLEQRSGDAVERLDAFGKALGLLA
ncbi:MAG: hypothetical protein AAGA48_01980 [Myxococcota bacterium]